MSTLGGMSSGVNVPEAELEPIFAAYDHDGSGTITFNELHAALRAAGATEQRSSHESSTEKISRPCGGRSPLKKPPVQRRPAPMQQRGLRQVVHDTRELSAELRRLMQGSLTRAIDLFRSMDMERGDSKKFHVYRQPTPFRQPRPRVVSLSDLALTRSLVSEQMVE